MTRGNKIVEQVDKYGDIVFDYDTSLTTSEIYNKLCEFFPGIYKDSDKMICGEYEGHKYAIRVKNITYLGHPHPLFKKRIQIPDDLREFYNKAVKTGRTPILLGIYTHEDNLLFGEFNIEDFIDKKAHNSSAHVYTSDIVEAVVEGISQKIDYFGNRITVFKPEYTEVFLEDLMGEPDNVVKMLREHAASEEDKPAAGVKMMQTPAKLEKSKLDEVLEKIEDFIQGVDKVWNGKECYDKMVAADYRNKYQAEWAGFFLEYEFESYIQKNDIAHLITYAQDKKDGGIDLDLFFPALGSYGDLKAHSDNSRGIQGNDWGTIHSLISGTDEHVFYIVCEHSTVKDSERDYVVTQYWNKLCGKSNLMSYSSRMKNQVTLKKLYVLDINSANKEYLTMFKQGVNSNGKLREPKIMIQHDKLDKFVIAEINL